MNFKVTYEGQPNAHEHSEGFWDTIYVTSKLTSLSLNLVMSNSFAWTSSIVEVFHLRTFDSNQITSPSIITFRLKRVHEICLQQSLGKYVPILTLDPCSSYLAWPPTWVLIFQPIYDTFKLSFKWWQRKKSKFNIIFTTESFTTKIFWKVPLWYLHVSFYKWLNSHWTPIIYPSYHKWTLNPPNPNVENYLIGHKLDSIHNFQK